MVFSAPWADSIDIIVAFSPLKNEGTNPMALIAPGVDSPEMVYLQPVKISTDESNGPLCPLDGIS